MNALPTHIVVTCPACGHENVFHQPYPYHAGLSNQGFLYNESGDRTLIWSSFDRDYQAIAGQKQPWTLDPVDQERLEERLLLAPDGTRWLFRNPARCLNCGHPISEPMTATAFYLRYDDSVDRAASRSQGHGLKDVLTQRRPSVPWNTRDVWLGVLAAVLIIAASFGLVLLLRAFSVQTDIDFWIVLFPSLFELLFLVPVWWFAIHKYRASLKTLGFARFKLSNIGVGIGLLFAFYIFNGAYAYLLREFGLRVQTDLTPVLSRLSNPWPLFVAVVLVAPVAEETFFRGFVFGGLRSRYDWHLAAAISAALFAAAHLEITFFIPAFILGYLFAYLYQRSGSIWPGMILHALVNAFAMTVVYLQM